MAECPLGNEGPSVAAAGLKVGRTRSASCFTDSVRTSSPTMTEDNERDHPDASLPDRLRCREDETEGDDDVDAPELGQIVEAAHRGRSRMPVPPFRDRRCRSRSSGSWCGPDTRARRAAGRHRSQGPGRASARDRSRPPGRGAHRGWRGAAGACRRSPRPCERSRAPKQGPVPQRAGTARRRDRQRQRLSRPERRGPGAASSSGGCDSMHGRDSRVRKGASARSADDENKPADIACFRPRRRPAFARSAARAHADCPPGRAGGTGGALPRRGSTRRSSSPC